MRKFSACTTTEKCTKFVSGTQKRQAYYSLNNNKLSSVPSCWGVIMKYGWEPASESLKQTAIYTLFNLTVGSFYAMQMEMQMQMKMKINV